MVPVSSLNIPSETRTMLGISTFKNTKSFSHLEMAKWIKLKFGWGVVMGVVGGGGV